MEKTNARYLKRADFKEDIDFITGDLSFISLTLILPVVKELLSPSGTGVFLIKPQFELEKNKNIKGIVKNNKFRYEAVENIIEFCKEIKITPEEFEISPIKGPKGNIEYLLKISTPYKIENIIDIEKIKENFTD
jgi:23S rRNA (cytidine1920-2'-O)/16S rRNA (cytidine1409-2'-O)-methyltransferase